jgi:hypothetical protein
MADKVLRLEIKEGNEVLDYVEFYFKNGKPKDSKTSILRQVKMLIEEIFIREVTNGR